MAEGWDGRERRKSPRVIAGGEIRGRIHTEASVPVVNLSAAGALLEIPCALRIGAVYTLRLILDGGRLLEIKGKVTRSYVHGFDRNSKGETVIIYRAAVQFGTLSDEQRALLQNYVERKPALARGQVHAHR